MAITIIQQPQTYMPAYNPQWFMALSNQLAQPNFEYTIKITDLISSATETYQLPPRPDNLCVFDAGVFAENQIRNSNFIPINLYGWQKANGIRKIRVNIGETYGSTPVYHAGTNIDYIIWNSCVRFLDFPSYNENQFVYESVTPNLIYFAGVLDDITTEDRSNYMYILSSRVNDVDQIQITTRDINGTFIANSFIANPFAAAANYFDRYFCIDVGYKGLISISSGLVTGAYPIITPFVSSYEITDTSSTLISSQQIKRIRIKCEDTRYAVMTVHYLARNGAFLSLNFNKAWESNNDKTVTGYMQNQNKVEPGSSVYGYNYFDSPEKQLSVLTQTKLKLRTDWLTDEQVTQYQECFDSPICYLDTGHIKSYAAIKPVTGSYRNLPHFEKKVFMLEMDFQYTHQNYRQRT